MCDTTKAAPFCISLLFIFSLIVYISIYVPNAKHRSVHSAGGKKPRNMRVRFTVFYIVYGVSYANGYIAIIGISICKMLYNVACT